jgi:hypothetical protein
MNHKDQHRRPMAILLNCSRLHDDQEKDVSKFETMTGCNRQNVGYATDADKTILSNVWSSPQIDWRQKENQQSLVDMKNDYIQGNVVADANVDQCQILVS